MESRNENSNQWKEKFSQLGHRNFGKGNNISFSLINKAGIEPDQYEHIYNKLKEWNTFLNYRNIEDWQIKLLSGEEHYFKKYASLVAKHNENLLFYAIWSGNLSLAQKCYKNNPADFYKEQFGLGIGFIAVCSQNIEILEWIKIIDSSQLTILKEENSVAMVAVQFGYTEILQWLCNFDLNLLNTKGMFSSLTYSPTSLPFIIYLHENKFLPLLTDYEYLAYFAVEANNVPLYKWIVRNQPELLNQLADRVDMNLLQFAAYSGSDEMFSLVFNNQPNLIEAKDKNGLGFMEYAFLLHYGRVNFALGLSTQDYCFTLNVPNKCEINYNFGQLNNLYGLSFHAYFKDTARAALLTNYRIQAINLPEEQIYVKANGTLLPLLLLNQERLQKEAQMAAILWLLLQTGIRSVCFNFPQDCLETIFKNCFLENKKPQERYLYFFNKLPAIPDQPTQNHSNKKKKTASTKRCVIF